MRDNTDSRSIFLRISTLSSIGILMPRFCVIASAETLSCNTTASACICAIIDHSPIRFWVYSCFRCVGALQ